MGRARLAKEPGGPSEALPCFTLSSPDGPSALSDFSLSDLLVACNISSL